MGRWQGKNLASFPQQKISFAINPKEWDAYLPGSPKSFSSSDLGKEGLSTNVTDQPVHAAPEAAPRAKSVLKIHNENVPGIYPGGGSTCQTIPQAHGFEQSRYHLLEILQGKLIPGRKYGKKQRVLWREIEEKRELVLIHLGTEVRCWVHLTRWCRQFEGN